MCLQPFRFLVLLDQNSKLGMNYKAFFRKFLLVDWNFVLLLLASANQQYDGKQNCQSQSLEDGNWKNGYREFRAYVYTCRIVIHYFLYFSLALLVVQFWDL